MIYIIIQLLIFLRRILWALKDFPKLVHNHFVDSFFSVAKKVVSPLLIKSRMVPS